MGGFYFKLFELSERRVKYEINLSPESYDIPKKPKLKHRMAFPEYKHTQT